MNVPAGFYNTCMTESFAGNGGFEKCRSCVNGVVGLTALERGGEKLEYGKGSTVSADDVRGILASKPATATVVHDLIVKYRKQFQETVADDGDLDDLLTAFSIELREAWGIK